MIEEGFTLASKVLLNFRNIEYISLLSVSSSVAHVKLFLIMVINFISQTVCDEILSYKNNTRILSSLKNIFPF